MSKCVVVDTTKSPWARLRPVPVNAVKLRDSFWGNRIEVLRKVTIPTQYEELEGTGRIENFRKVARGDKDIIWRIADDSDVYKWVEAAAFTLAYEYDSNIERMLEEVVDAISSAQDEDGYLFTYYAYDKRSRWKDLIRMHELYCAGHLFQAAIAYYRATGRDKLLNTAIRLADHIADVFGPDGQSGAPGHPEIEMALVEMYRQTGREKYLELARFFLDQRGKGLLGGDIVLIDHKPFRELDSMVGHAVRAIYLCCGATDIYLETGDESLYNTLERLWRSMMKRMYITGGVGSRYHGEAFGEDYELPNVRAYAETCAAVANVMWNWRMLMVTAEARFTDVIETVIYNGALSGISLDGRHYFYVNPLADRGRHSRQEWFRCACCPPNIARLLASLPGYFYSTSSKGIWIHLYASSTSTIELNGRIVELTQETKYPWEGRVKLKVNPEKTDTFSLFIRIPEWCEEVKIIVEKKEFKRKVLPGSYLKIERDWHYGDTIEVLMSMKPTLIVSHPHVLGNTDRVAIKRGPIVYCLEHIDNPDFDVWDIVIPPDIQLKEEFRSELLNGIVVVRGRAFVIDSKRWENRLYLPLKNMPLELRKVEFRAIPYYAWANREPGPMIVWLRSIVPKNNP
ncbi:MAG: glycoside hydrolase family 127 protein [Thermoprotei archaeon]|nr:MAG: glycoside hydrolase family 127 protein [Thermoprotei archaeon]